MDCKNWRPLKLQKETYNVLSSAKVLSREGTPVAGDALDHGVRVHPHICEAWIMVNLNWNLSWTEK